MAIARIALATLLASVVACAADSGPDEPLPDPVPIEADEGADAGNEEETPAELLAFMSTCTADEECETGLCFEFNTKGPHCTHECNSDLECEDPSPGCNGKGVCKAPGGDGGGDGSGGGTGG